MNAITKSVDKDTIKVSGIRYLYVGCYKNMLTTRSLKKGLDYRKPKDCVKYGRKKGHKLVAAGLGKECFGGSKHSGKKNNNCKNCLKSNNPKDCGYHSIYDV